MPTYEYECRKCGHHFERFQSISAPPVKRCPECKGAVKRLLGTGAGLLFKGSGFYITDYRSDGYKQSAKSDSAPAAAPAKESAASPAPAASKAAESSTKKPAAAKASKPAKAAAS